MSDSASSTGTSFRAIGFCGADDSVHPNLLAIVSRAYPVVEFGVLFRPDREGQPRYASPDWVERLGAVAARNPSMKLAAHLCGSRVDDVLDDGAGGAAGSDFLRSLVRLGFRRVQINATAVNGVDTSRLGASVETFLRVAGEFPDLEFILQKSEETRPLWEGVLKHFSSPGTGNSSSSNSKLPKNVSMLVDESKGTGSLAQSWPSPPDGYEIGYAGGIGPDNIGEVLEDVRAAAPRRAVWIDMESSLRSVKDGRDVFDLAKCYHVIDVACKLGVTAHPEFLS